MKAVTIWYWNMRELSWAFNYWGGFIEEVGIDLYYGILDLG